MNQSNLTHLGIFSVLTANLFSDLVGEGYAFINPLIEVEFVLCAVKFAGGSRVECDFLCVAFEVT
jgi:hypothetical protein